MVVGVSNVNDESVVGGGDYVSHNSNNNNNDGDGKEG